jgi:hypothetical protein
MAKTKVSEWDVVADNNQDISGITLGTGMPPSYVNDSIREMMSQIKDWQSGSSGDDYTINGTLNINGSLKLDGSTGTAGQVLVSNGTATPKWGDAFVTGMIMLWSGSTNSVPSGWRLCDGGGGTPDLRNRFVVGAYSDTVTEEYPSCPPNAKGGSANAVAISHSHTFSGSTNNAGSHNHYVTNSKTSSTKFSSNNQTFTWASAGGLGNSDYRGGATNSRANRARSSDVGNHSHSISGTTSASGSSGTNKNLPPYYALAYIMKV